MAVHFTAPAQAGRVFSTSATNFVRIADFLQLKHDPEDCTGQLRVRELRRRLSQARALLDALEAVTNGANDEAVITFG